MENNFPVFIKSFDERTCNAYVRALQSGQLQTVTAAFSDTVGSVDETDAFVAYLKMRGLNVEVSFHDGFLKVVATKQHHWAYPFVSND